MNSTVHTPGKSREVEHVVAGMEASDGAGVRLQRVLTQELQRRLDPFLMLDEFRSDNPDDYIAGFPEHPHRGFETVTYMLAGRMRHRDNAGNEGLLTAGGVQWMTAGRGILHSEIPEQEDGLMHGFQLWVNLASDKKMIDPGYQDLPASAIPEYTSESCAHIRVIAGESEGVAGAISRPDTEPLYLDIELAPGKHHWQAIPASHNAFIYVYSGEVLAGDSQRKVTTRRLAALSGNRMRDHQGEGIALQSAEGARLLLIAGRPLNEPIAQWGPFVMNTREQIEQAVTDFRNGDF
ncbi:hypothetical protein C4K68_03725 [Pokkaliibacter plantistimulans]|uniref:Pirin family protein n=1 Tax=Proteobacteria bacterium 228 TaxID=2083153 RepID=A0A2S5KVU4_9PROT|nr:pirin family protein [Pokkaliibacter plantistimulans]PPC78629.1 hypothetical protein C4K68_03725 [Pokkaliibacter plantistimulans]